MINLIIIFLEQISKSVLPYKVNKIINHPYMQIFKFFGCMSIIMLFIFKKILYVYIIHILLIINYFYIIYIIFIITIKLYYGIYLFKIDLNSYSFTHSNHKYMIFKLAYNLISLIINVYGIPIISDTILEILSNIKYIIKQIKRRKI
jgi:hypothetical protein